MFNDFGKKPPSFGDATEVANSIIQSGVEYAKGIIIYNKFK
jgi:ATP synthase gamma chain (fragment)